MIKTIILEKKSLVLTPKELKVIKKKLSGAKMNQQDSNYLSRYIRPKLKEIKEIDAKLLLEKLEYNQKGLSIEKKIINNLKYLKPKAIILYGSAIQTNYNKYNDIDILIVFKDKIWTNLKDESYLINEIKNKIKLPLNLDIRIISEKDLLGEYSHNPSLIYQLEDSKVIYGKINLPKKIELYNINLKMKLDWTIIEENIKGIELYKALRNVLLVRLLLNKIIDNKKLHESINMEIGENLIKKLKENRESKEERKLIKYYLKNLIKETYKMLEGDLWEKRVELKV